MNVLTDPWIPCRTDAGEVVIRNVQGALSDDVVALAFARSDLDDATALFLVAVLQTAAVRDESWLPDWEAWDRRWRSGCGDMRLEPLLPAFDLAVLMQRDVTGDPLPAGRLRPESPSDNSIANNKDVTVWRSSVVERLPLHEAIAHLLQLQMMSLAWGGGFTEGVVPGSTAFTMLTAAGRGVLWRNLLLNVLPRVTWNARLGEPGWKDHIVFPWLAGLPAGDFTPAATHPLLAYWGAPKAVRFELSEDELVAWRRMKHKRTLVGFTHPLVPYHTDKEGQLHPQRLRDMHIGYDYWAGIAVRSPSLVLREQLDRGLDVPLGLRVFGWVSAKADIGAYLSSELPVVHLDANRRDIAQAMVAAADDARKRLYGAANALAREPRLASIYGASEAAFYASVRSLAAGEDPIPAWTGQLRRIARDIFDRFVAEGRYDVCDVARARARL